MSHLERKVCPRHTPAALLATLATVCVAAAAGAQSDSATGMSLRFTAFSFVAEGGATADADSATLVVPMNRAARPARGRSATVRLPIVRFRATATPAVPSAFPGTAAAARVPIIYLSGGSGSGISAARGARFPLFQALRQVGDVITFDLRGAGRSIPRLACPSDAPIPADQPLAYDDLVALLRRNARACADSLRGAGVDLAGFNLRETVADIETIRLALGADRIALVGISTGSQIGLEYVRRHGAHVARAVLAGVQGPDQLVDLPSEQEAVVREFSARLAGQRTPSASPAPSADLLATIRAVVDSLTARPTVVRVRDRRSGDSLTVRLGALDAQILTSATLGDRRQMQVLPAVFGAAARGNFAPLATFKLEASRGGINSAFEALQDCQTGVAPERLAARAREARTGLLGWGTLDFPEHCAGWGVPRLDASWRSPVRSDAAVLLISGTLDGRTSVQNARAVLDGLPRALHLVIGGASHGDDLFLATPDVGATIVAFLRGERPRELRLEL